MTYEEDVEGLRTEIDRLNADIMEKLAERVEVARQIGEVKRRHGLPIVDRRREAKVYERIRESARKRGLDPEGVVRVFKEIIRLCTEVQMEK